MRSWKPSRLKVRKKNQRRIRLAIHPREEVTINLDSTAKPMNLKNHSPKLTFSLLSLIFLWTSPLIHYTCGFQNILKLAWNGCQGVIGNEIYQGKSQRLGRAWYGELTMDWLKRWCSVPNASRLQTGILILLCWKFWLLAAPRLPSWELP